MTLNINQSEEFLRKVADLGSGNARAVAPGGKVALGLVKGPANSLVLACFEGEEGVYNTPIEGPKFVKEKFTPLIEELNVDYTTAPVPPIKEPEVEKVPAEAAPKKAKKPSRKKKKS